MESLVNNNVPFSPSFHANPSQIQTWINTQKNQINLANMQKPSGNSLKSAPPLDIVSAP